MLSLGFVEDVPHDDGGTVPMRLNHGAEFDLKLIGFDGLRIAGVGINGGHILPHEQSELVGPVIPALALDLEVLAHHVEPEGFGLVEIEFKGGIGWGSVNSIRPKTLVQRSHLEEKLVI